MRLFFLGARDGLLRGYWIVYILDVVDLCVLHLKLYGATRFLLPRRAAELSPFLSMRGGGHELYAVRWEGA